MTDIEGSTDLWENSPEAMAEGLAIHNALVRALLVEHHGYEIKSEGDAFALAFGDANQALAWCLALQRALPRMRWPAALGPEGLRVRAGLHVGTPIRITDPVTGRVDFLGPALNRAARVSAAGHGGQVLLSDAAWQALDPALEAEDLGLYALRGINAPERIRQVHPPDAPRRPSRPLRAARWRPASPLAGDDQFIGRASDLASIASLIASGERLITLKGPGGTGKTRLARRFGAEREAEFPGGVVFCDLSEARTGSAVLSAVTRALGLTPTAGDTEVAAVLQGRGKTLLILDNLEQVIEAAARHVGAWLSGGAPSVLLVTSRRSLRVDGEVVLPIPPLSLPAPGLQSAEALLTSEAAQLYVERANERRAQLSLDPRGCADIAALVRRLDGLPLAIELAAAWARMLPPAAVMERMPTDAIARPGDERAGRQATLVGLVRWSTQLLSPAEREAFAQLSVFEGGFSVTLAEAVVDLSAWPDAPPVAEVLEHLVEHSLVRRAEPGRRLGLLVTLQDQARALLGERPGARAAAERRHREAMAALLARSARPLDLRDERENLLAALRRALALGEAHTASPLGLGAIALLRHTGPYAEALELARALHLLEGPTDAARSRHAHAVGDCLRLTGQIDEARGYLEEALQLARAAGDAAALLDALITLGMLEHDRRQLAAARERYAEALELALRLGDGSKATFLHVNLSHAYRESGDFERAGAELRAARARCPAEDTWNFRRVLSADSLFQMNRGEHEGAARALRELVALARADGDQTSEITALGNLADAEAALGNLEEALRCAERTVALARRMGHRRLTAINLGNMGDIFLELGRLDEAEPALREAIGLARAAGVRDAEGAFMGSLGLVLARRGDPVAGWRELERGAAALIAISNPLELLRLRIRQLEVARGLGHPLDALLAECRGLLERLGMPPESAMARAIAACAGSPAAPAEG